MRWEQLCQVGFSPPSGVWVPCSTSLNPHTQPCSPGLFDLCLPQRLSWAWNVTVLWPFYCEEVTSCLNSCCSCFGRCVTPCSKLCVHRVTSVTHVTPPRAGLPCVVTSIILAWHIAVFLIAVHAWQGDNISASLTAERPSRMCIARSIPNFCFHIDIFKAKFFLLYAVC